MISSASGDPAIVVGGGNAGLCAAITAAESGSKVILLESAPQFYRAGNTKYTRDIRYLHDHDKYTDGSYNFEEFYSDLDRVSGNRLNSEMAEFTIRSSVDVAEWMENHGIIFKREIRGTLNLNRTNAFFLGGGKALSNTYYMLAEKLGVKIMYGATVTDIRIREGSFMGVSVFYEGGRIDISGRSVVAASGVLRRTLTGSRIYGGERLKAFRSGGQDITQVFH